MDLKKGKQTQKCITEKWAPTFKEQHLQSYDMVRHVQLRSDIS